MEQRKIGRCHAAGLEDGGRDPQASSCQNLEKTKGRFPPRGPADTPWFQPSEIDFGPLASRIVREYISVVLSQQVYGSLLQ